MRLRFDRSEPGVWVSGAVHAAALGALLLAVASEKFPEAQEGIPVEVVTENQVSEMTRGERTAPKPQADPRPRAERVAEKIEQRDPGEARRDVPAPPTRPPDMKTADEPVAAAAPQPIPLPPTRPEVARSETRPAPEPAKTPEPPRREPVQQAEPKPAPAPPRREDLAKLIEQQEAEVRAKAEAQAKAEAEAARARAAEAKLKAEAEARAKAEFAERQRKLAETRKAEAEARAKRQAELAERFDPNGIARLLQSKEAAQSSGSTGREQQRTAALGTATGAASRLNPSLRDALLGILQKQLHECWSVPPSLEMEPNPPVPMVRFSLNPDATLASQPTVVNSSPHPLFRVAADSATRAVRQCRLRIPAQFQPYYQDWKDLAVNFNPRDMI